MDLFNTKKIKRLEEEVQYLKQLLNERKSQNDDFKDNVKKTFNEIGLTLSNPLYWRLDPNPNLKQLYEDFYEYLWEQGYEFKTPDCKRKLVKVEEEDANS